MKKVTFGKKKGFTLLELLIVVVVLAVLAGLALPQYLKTVGRAKEAEGWQTLAGIRSAIIRYYSEAEILPTNDTFTELDIDDPNDGGLQPNSWFSYNFVAGAGPGDFLGTATPGGNNPAPGRTGIRTLTIDRAGSRTVQ